MLAVGQYRHVAHMFCCVPCWLQPVALQNRLIEKTDSAMGAGKLFWGVRLVPASAQLGDRQGCIPDYQPAGSRLVGAVVNSRAGVSGVTSYLDPFAGYIHDAATHGVRNFTPQLWSQVGAVMSLAWQCSWGCSTMDGHHHSNLCMTQTAAGGQKALHNTAQA